MNKKTHHLKILPEYFSLILRGQKTFELRKDDRGFQREDTIVLIEINAELRSKDNPDGCTGRRMLFEIAGVARNLDQFGLKPGYCILSFNDITSFFDNSIA